MTGLLIGILTFYPLFMGILHFGNPQLETAMNKSPATIIADPADCSFQFAPNELKGHMKFTSSCDILKNLLNKYSVPYYTERGEKGSLAKMVLRNMTVESVDIKDMKVGIFGSNFSGDFWVESHLII